MPDDATKPAPSLWKACTALASALLIFAVLWTAALLLLYPDRLRSPGALGMALGLDLVPAALHALALAVSALLARKPWGRTALAFVLGIGLVAVPWAMRATWADPAGTISAALSGGLVWGMLTRAIATSALPFGDILARGSEGIRRATGLALSAAAALAAVVWIDAGFRFSLADWALAMLREAPFVWAWMSVPLPVRETKTE
jgi:hypothetical protein